MKSLYLLRHAKSDWSHPALPDHDRPLAPRGERACATIAKYLSERKGGAPAPDAIHCSTALRARMTLERVKPALASAPEPDFHESLYLCGEVGVFDHLRALPDTVERILVVGHNPDFQRLVLRLCSSGDLLDLEAIREKLPTASFLEIELPAGPWSELVWRSGALRDFATPRRITGEQEETNT